MPEIYGTRSRKMEVTYDYYRIFYYAAKYKSFSQAATILMSNQPNVTRAIHNLDADYLSDLTGGQSLHRRENGFIHMLQLHTSICMQQN